MINWKEIPFVRFFLPFAVGIALSIILENNHPIWYVIILLFFLIRFVLAFRRLPFQYRWFHGIVANVLLFLLGYLWCFHHNELKSDNHFSQYLHEENILFGVVSNTPEFENYIKATLSTSVIESQNDSLKNCDGNLLIFLKNDSLRQLKYGDVVAFKGRIQKVDAPKNPHAFNYQRFLHFQNIHYQVFVNDFDNWKITASDQGNYIQGKATQIRKYFLGILEKHLTTPQELAVGNALILGYKDDLNEEIQTAYAHTGALHVLAVSGLHVGLVAWFVNILLGFFKSKSRIWKFTKMSILIGVVWSFALVTGGSPSVLRAATMFTFLIIGLSVNRTTNIYNSLAISATFLLVWNPYLLMSVGFQLSYLAVMGIVYFQPKIFRAWFIKNSFLRSLWNLATVSFGAQIGTLPLSLYYFHSLPFFAWLSGIIVIPAATVILGSGLLLLLFESVIPTLAFLPGAILYYSIWIMNNAIFFIQKIPWSVLVGLWIGLGVVALMYILIGNIVLVLSTKNLRWLLPATGFSLLICINFSFVSFQEIQQKRITIYHSYKNTILDFYDGKSGISFSNENILEKNLSFSTQNNRWANGIKNIQQLHFQNQKIKTDHLVFHQPFIQFYNKKILIVDEQFEIKNIPKIKLDFILLRNHPKIDIEILSQYFDFEQLLFDCSNPQWKIEKWKTTCEELKITYYDIYEKGAFELVFD